ncbi:MAG: hypothetical protein D6705_09740 [Deltaproteobacteria bacterium]|nr:MAG: hypothetical protein D6705_09740 [Deltaproteobacteria bacterium]
MARTILTCLSLSLALATAACGKNAPDGTTPPEDGAQAADDGGKGGKRTRGKGKRGAKGDGDEGGEKKADVKKACKAEISDTPAPLFLHPETGEPMAFIRVPKGMTKDDLVEQNPFFYMTMSQDGFVSTCDAMVTYMAAAMIDDEPKKDFQQFAQDFLTQLGYQVESFENPKIEGRRLEGAVLAKSQQGPAKLWVLFDNKYNAGKVFIVVLEAHPNAFEAIQPTFKAVTDSLIVVPPETPEG